MQPRALSLLLLAGLVICTGWIVTRVVEHEADPPPVLEQGRSQTAVKESEQTATPAKSWSVADRVQLYGEDVRRRIEPDFRRAGVAYPPAALVFVVLKQEKTLEVHAAGRNGKFRFVRAYPILAASGKAGPKLQEGDLQVPEGLYRIESLNPNSLFHVSLRINYPNEFDRRNAQAENRTDLGGDIMIHGDALSVGCLAMGDPASEDLFVLAALTGHEHIQLIMSPLDLRIHETPPPLPGTLPWVGPMYKTIAREMHRYPVAARDDLPGADNPR